MMSTTQPWPQEQPGVLNLTPGHSWRERLAEAGVAVSPGQVHMAENRLLLPWSYRLPEITLAHLPAQDLLVCEPSPAVNDFGLAVILSAVASVLDHCGGPNAVLLPTEGRVPWLVHMHKGDLRATPWWPSRTDLGRCPVRAEDTDWGLGDPVANDAGEVYLSAQAFSRGMGVARTDWEPVDLGSADPPRYTYPPLPAPTSRSGLFAPRFTTSPFN